MNRRVKFILYLIVSDLFISLNTVSLTTGSDLSRRRAQIGKSNSLETVVNPIVNDIETTTSLPETTTSSAETTTSLAETTTGSPETTTGFPETTRTINSTSSK